VSMGWEPGRGAFSMVARKKNMDTLRQMPVPMRNIRSSFHLQQIVELYAKHCPLARGLKHHRTCRKRMPDARHLPNVYQGIKYLRTQRSSLGLRVYMRGRSRVWSVLALGSVMEMEQRKGRERGVNDVGEEEKVNMSKKGSDGRSRVRGGTRWMKADKCRSMSCG